MENKYNLKSPAVKRLMKEAAELRDPTEHYHAQPLEPNGRFEVGKKICLSISGHHPETWQPSWSIRTALIAIIGFMPTKGEGAIGSLDYTPEERRALAKKSQDFCCEACGCSMRSALLALSPNSNPSPEDHKAKELAQQINFKAESSSSRQASESGGAESEPSTLAQEESSTSGEQEDADEPQAEQAEASPADEEEEGPRPSPTPGSGRPLSPRQRRAQQHSQQQGQRDVREPASRPTFPVFAAAPRPPQDAGRAGSAVLIVVLTLALAALIFRRIYLANEYKFDYEL
uniref:ubiquitin-conjugating enzyme E2 J1 isoform X2 n=1 Tax=Centroberyx gerrardi TaxID=166262 RepID=UPI003AAC5F72